MLGIGNLLMGDEGVGVHAVAELQREAWPAAVTIADGGTGGFHLLSFLREFDPVVIIDATLDGQPPGQVSVIEPRFASDFPRSLAAHDIGLRDLVEAAAVLGPLPRLHLVTVSIASVQPMQLTLSAEVAAALPQVAATVRRFVAQRID